ncbi:hypothetical protein N9L68_00690 [bacterium]|nr:hypothetical protein [bacterium]
MPPPAAKAGAANTSQVDWGPPVKSPPLGPSIVVSKVSVSLGNPTALLKGPWIATAVDAYLSVLEGQKAVTPEVVAHYRTLCGLVDKWKDNQGHVSEYQRLTGNIHVVHQRQGILVDVWRPRAYQARRKEVIVPLSVSSGPTYPAKAPVKLPCSYELPQKSSPAKSPPGLESRVNQVLMMHHEGSEEMSEEEGMPRAVTFKEHSRQRAQAGCPIPGYPVPGGPSAKAVPPAPKPMMFAKVQEAEAYLREEQERVGEAQRQSEAANSQGDEPAAVSNAEHASAVSSEETMTEPSRGESERVWEI